MEKINVARSKGVLAGGAGAAAITDGISTSKSYWDGGVAPSTALIDLGGYFDISSLRLVTYYGDGRYYHYEVFASPDGAAFTKIAEKKDDVPATEEGTTFNFPELTAKYIKIVMLYNSNNPSCHVTECEVFGVENKTYTPAASFDAGDSDNIALHKPCRTNSNQSFAFLCTNGSGTIAWTGEDYPR